MSLTFEERLILALARDPRRPETGATPNYTLDNCLDFARKTVPDLLEHVRGKKVLDFGCGPGWQAVALSKLGAGEVWGVDILEEYLAEGRELARHHQQDVRFVREIPDSVKGTFDVVLSFCAFEHYADPGGMIQLMRSMTKKHGRVIITFAEPWYSHSGSHIAVFSALPVMNVPIPWLNLLFSDRALLTLRSRFRPERPTRLEDIPGGLNRMTIARFERLIRDSGMAVERLQIHATLGLPLVTRVPVFRELLSSAATCILRLE